VGCFAIFFEPILPVWRERDIRSNKRGKA